MGSILCLYLAADSREMTTNWREMGTACNKSLLLDVNGLDYSHQGAAQPDYS